MVLDVDSQVIIIFLKKLFGEHFHKTDLSVGGYGAQTNGYAAATSSYGSGGS